MRPDLPNSASLLENVMNFDNIDPTLEIFSKENAISILREDASPFRRYFYISDKTARTIQIVIEPERDGLIRIDLHAIEEINDEFHVIIHDVIENISGAIRYAFFIAKSKIEHFH
jgi:hypothetical protein